ncbi:MAG TPA: hypothetical protein ACFYD4_10080 [Candidatus Wunengus sp. YC61]|uniref:hypothetical protein n=1 Tax=Candidatus Wunengus sp. YC61 TaxID=3367698 RepID=UPI0040289708
MNNDKKTTVAAAIAAGSQIVGLIAPMFGVFVPNEVFQGISAIALFVLGFFTNKK